MKHIRAWVAFLTVLGALVGGIGAVAPQLTNAGAPATPKVAQSPPAVVRTVGGGYFVDKNGIYSPPGSTGEPGQPQNKTVQSEGLGASTMEVSNTTVVTYLKGAFARNSQQVTKVSFSTYNGPSAADWSAWSSVTSYAGTKTQEPTSTMTFKIPVSTTPGTYYFQLKIDYDHKGWPVVGESSNPESIYTAIFSVTVLPKKATALMVTPPQQSVLWGQPAKLTAEPTPGDTTTPVTWSADRTDLGSLSTTTGLTTTFQSGPVAGATDPKLRTDNGTDVTVTASAKNSDTDTVTGNGKVTLGGAAPKVVERGEPLNFPMNPGIDTSNFPTDAQYRWVIYKENLSHNLSEYTPTAAEDAQLNQRDFKWGKVQAGGATKMYYQLQVTSNNGATTWYSNIAPIDITETPVTPALVAVPNLQFVKPDGSDPSVGDFDQAGGLTLKYRHPVNMTPATTFDGNNTGFLKVRSHLKLWHLSVQVGPFKNTTTNHVLAQRPTLALHFANGGTATQTNLGSVDFAAAGIDTRETVETNLTPTTTLSVPRTAVQAGTYQAEVTWTLEVTP